MSTATKVKNNKLSERLVNEWHPTKNGDLTPYGITHGVNRKAWWKCEKGHEWEAIINNRRKTGCPYCSRIKVNKDNCLATTNPKLAKEWHPTRNGILTPYDVTHGVNRKVWWKCEKGHEWRAIINSRKKANCPYCARTIGKEKCLAILNPELAKEWHTTKNGSLTPNDVGIWSRISAWWKCEKGHEWKTQVQARHRQKTKCPYCANRKVSKENCLATLNPKLAKERHPTKNGNLTPHDVTTGSGKKIRWKCSKGHEWNATILSRKRAGCPHCAWQANENNCLATLNPKAAKEWHPTKNGPLTPYDVRSGIHKMAWWICDKGHEWETRICNRKKHGCPYCSRQKANKENCLATIKPELVKEWHPTKNVDVTPYDVSYGSGKRVWWKCRRGHTWESEIRKKSGCPRCRMIKLRNKIEEGTTSEIV